MRTRSLALLMTVMAAPMLTPLSVSANTVFYTVPGSGETTSDVIQVAPSDIVTDSAPPFFGASDGAASLHSDEADFLSPEFLLLQPGSFPPRLYGTQEILNAVPEPSSTPWLTCGLLTIAWIGGRKRH